MIRTRHRRSKRMDILEATRQLFPQFTGSSWASWHVFLQALFRIDRQGNSFLKKEFLAVYLECTGRTTVPKSVREAWVIVGRRGGKSVIASLVAVYLACFKDYSRILAPGERGTVMLIAADRKQARVLMRYVVGLLEQSPVLAQLIEHKTTESVELSNRVNIEIHTASFRSTHGYTIVGSICDKVAFWRSEDSASPDSEVLNAIRPGMASVKNSLLLCISSPYARRGELFRAYQKHFGQEEDDTLVWQAPTRQMNPMISKSFIRKELAKDESAARAEYLAEFRSDVESYILLEALQAVTVSGRQELLPDGARRYFAFTDPSGGSSDSFTLAVAHREQDRIVLDCVREARPPFSPEQVVGEFSRVLKRYRVQAVEGDRYAGEWPSEAFAKRGIRYIPAENSKSILYQSLLPLINIPSS